MMREINELVRELWEDELSRGRVPLLVYEAPTGYGKSWLLLDLYASAYEHDLAARLIHAAPTRSLVESLYEEKYLGRLRDGDPLLSRAGVSCEEDIGFQSMSLLRAGKDPMFTRRIVATTIDSLFLNQFKVPVGEIGRDYCHYELPRSSIASAMIAYDEAHLYGGDPGAPEEATFTMFMASLRSHVHPIPKPTAVVTATMPSQTLKCIEAYLTRLSGHGRLFKVIRVAYGEDGWVDEEWEEACSLLSVETNMLRDHEVKDRVVKLVEQGLRVLVVLNTPSRATMLYQELTGFIDNVVLVHGRLTLMDRERAYKALRECRVLIATQVIEVGMDMDFDVLITDPAPASSLIQRAGRVCRDVKERIKQGRSEGQVLIISDGSIQPYKKEIVETTLNIVKAKRSVNWRGIRGRGDVISAKRLLDEVYKAYPHALTLDPSTLTALIEIDAKPYLQYKQVRELYEQLLITTRGDLLIPVYVGEEEPEGYWDLLQGSVPVSYKWLTRRFYKVLEVSKGGQVKGYFLKPGRGTEDVVEAGFIEIKPDRGGLKELLVLSFEKGLLALKARSSVYRPRLGLLV